jgi:hypothetical protein
MSATVYYGWYCPAIQQLRINNPSYHMFRGKMIQAPPYSYYATPDGRTVLVTEITESSTPTDRQVKNGDIFLGEITTYCERSYTRRNNQCSSM